MNAKQFDALVNKGAITQVGIVDDAEKLDANDFTDLHMTQHEAVAEVLADASDNNEIEDVIPEEEPVAMMDEVPTETIEPASAPVEETPVVESAPVEETPVVESEPVVEETPAPAAKKSKKAKNVAPSVDPVE